MDVRRFLYGCVLLPFLWGESLPAQTFRRVRLDSELEDSARYVLAGNCPEYPDSIYVMSTQDETGTKATSRTARKIALDGDGRIHVDDGGTAVFELRRNGNTFSFRDMALDAWLAYSTKKVSSSGASLYTLTDEELDSLSTGESLYKTFGLGDYFSSGGMTAFLTKEDINIPGGKAQFHLLKNENSPVFRLYRYKDYCDTLFIYKKEVQPPALEEAVSGDWTFRGDWLSDSLFSLDYSRARRIDFTGIALPQGKQMTGAGKMPKEHVWTYVRKGEAGRLPEGWPCVVEIDRKDAGVQGTAVTRMVGCDSCTLGPKYSFAVPEVGIEWHRRVNGDGGWSSVGLPFAVKKVAWADADGEEVAVERLRFEEMTGEGAVFRETKDGEAWEGGVPYLWRPSEARDSEVCFYGEGTDVQTQAEGLGETGGFHAMFGRYDIKGDEGAVFLLDGGGTRFVRADAGSWIAPGRGYLVLPGVEALSVRLIEREQSTGVAGRKAQTGGRPVPVYGLDGTKRGETASDGRIPEEWPAGVYVTPSRKVVKK